MLSVAARSLRSTSKAVSTRVSSARSQPGSFGSRQFNRSLNTSSFGKAALLERKNELLAALAIVGGAGLYFYTDRKEKRNIKKAEKRTQEALDQAAKEQHRAEEAEEQLKITTATLKSEREQHEEDKKNEAEQREKTRSERRQRHSERKEARRKRKEEKKAAAAAAAETQQAVEPQIEHIAPEDAPAIPAAPSGDEDEEGPVYPTKYAIVGGGPAAFNAMKEILHLEPDAQILIISDDVNTPYDRSPLSKELFWQKDFNSTEQLKYPDWRGNLIPLEYHSSEFYTDPNKRLTFMSGRKVVDLDAGRHLLTLDDGTQFKYEKCLLAVGTTPRSLSDVGVTSSVALQSNNTNADVLPTHSAISTVKSASDFLALHHATLDPAVKHVTVIGNDFLAADLVDALVIRGRVTKAGTKVAQIFPDEGVLASVFPTYFAEYLTQKTQETGVDVRPKTRIENITEISESDNEHRLRITLADSEVIDTDHIVLSLGATPNVDLAKRAYLEVDEVSGGISVNAELEARTDLYVAGDAASFFDGHLGRRRVEGIDHAEISGKVAGLNMTGKNKAYTYQPIRWGAVAQNSTYQGVGLVDSRLDMVGVWQRGPSAPLVPDPNDSTGFGGLVPDANAPLSSEYFDSNKYERGVVYYMDGSKVVGVMMINVTGQMEVAKRLVTFPRNFDDLSRLRTQIYLGNKPKTEDEDQVPSL